MNESDGMRSHVDHVMFSSKVILKDPDDDRANNGACQRLKEVLSKISILNTNFDVFVLIS